MSNVPAVSDREAELIAALVDTGSVYAAAKAVGYASKTSTIHALSKSAVAKMLQQRLQSELQLVAAPAAVAYIRRVADGDEKQPNKLRVECCKIILDRAGFPGARGTAPQNAGNKELYEMSQSELRERIDRIQGELANRAPIVEATAIDVSAPGGAEPSSEPIDFLD